MIGGKNQAAQQPYAMGSLLQASTYGATIPVGYGRTQSPLLAIWAAHLRQGGSTKKFKQDKKGIVTYVENIDFLLGHNPIMGALQIWNNGGLYPLTFTSQTFTAAGGRASFTVTDAHFYAVIGVTLTQSYSATFNDYGGQGPQTASGSYEVPLWNELETGPDPTDPMSYRCWPFCYRWQPAFGATIQVDPESFPAGTLKIYYAQLMAATSFEPPIQRLHIAFESELGSGTEYADASLTAQQIIYPMFAGMGSSQIDLGSAGVIPQLQAELQFKWGTYATGDADFIDMAEDVVKSGLAQAAIGSNTAYTQLERGLSGYNLPGTIQKKVDSHASVALPPMLYDMPNTPGNILVVQCAAAGTLGISSSAGDVWTKVLDDATGYQVWYATAVGGQNTVTLSGASAPWEMAIYEIGGVGAVDTAAVTYAAGGAGALFVKEGVYSFADNNINVAFSDFKLSGTLPGDAVIQGMYPVAVVGSPVEYQGGFFNLTSSGGVFGGWSATAPGPGEYHAPSIGNSLSALNGQTINAGIDDSVVSGTGPCGWVFGYWYGSPSFFVVLGVGYAIYYTSATPSIDPYLPPPIAVPAGQGLAWAVPYAGTGNFPPTELLNRTTCTGFSNGASGSGSIALPGGGFIGQKSAPGGGSFVLDGSSTGTSVGSSITSGFDGYLMSLPWYSSGAPVAMQVPQWELLTPPNIFATTLADIQAHGRVIRNPGTYSIVEPGTPSQQVMLSLKSTGPSTYPRPVGDFMDLDSLNLTRLQCRAYGLWGSLSMTSQQAASDWLKTLYQAANAAPSFYGFNLYSIPYAEASAAGNGAIYISPTAAGPVVDLSTETGDILEGVEMVPVSRNDSPNVLQMQCIDRNSNYNPIVVSQPEAATIALYGMRKQDPVVINAVQDPTVARSLLGVAVRRNQYGADSYNFKVSAKHMLLAPMTLVTITDPLAKVVKVPVRLQQVGEDGSCTAKPFVYGMESPGALSVTGPTSYQPSTGDGAGNVNAPVIFEPVPRLYGSGTQAQLWLAVSSPAVNYGGCLPFISTDGGLSYNSAGDPLTGSAITGASTADWPAAPDPDSTNNLPLDLTESRGTLQSYQTSDEDNALYPCYIAGGGQPIPYELMTYAVATLTATFKYTLEATGSGNYLHRGVFNAPSAGVGVDHPSGSRFAFLWPSGQGILKLPLDRTWIGKTLWFKFCSFNNFGSAAQALGDVTAYPYTVLGLAGVGLPHETYTIDSGTVAGPYVLSQAGATEIDLVACTCSFGGLPPVNYSARALTIAAPTVPTWYYVTVADPTQQGESSATLPATCQASNALVGVQGNTYMGAILALPAGGAVQVLPGGWPAPGSVQVGP